MRRLNIPTNINHIITTEGIWEDESFDPILLTVMEFEYKGKDVIGFQMEFSAWEKLGKISELLEGKELNGYDWETLIRKYIKRINSGLEKNIHGDSEGESCVLWTESKFEFEKMMEFVFEIIDVKTDLTELIKHQ